MSENTSVAIIGIFVNDPTASVKVNEILHQYASSIVGRMGLPYRDRNLNIISIILDENPDIINQIAGKLGRIDGVSVKTMISNK